MIARPLTSYDYPAITVNVSGHAWRATRDAVRQFLRGSLRNTLGLVVFLPAMGGMLVALALMIALDGLARGAAPRTYERFARRVK